ncbi:dead/deah box helicase domain protein [beta proteobacterium KB13]|uniref:Dead/deah box helicase domain protein n=1 Tax=beta proteobacterium KB13 TaxID=314607 RepID=B6BTD3_9PROT|nr:dead/deah box helicase domain protein [beta proteobacterium KB13]
MSFSNFGFIPPIGKAISRINYSTPTPIQEQCIPVVLSGKDVLASAQTGTGKTAAFCLPLLNLVEKKPKHKHKRNISPDVLILSPTRELATQIEQELKRFSHFMDTNIVSVVGGVSYKLQNKLLKSNVNFLVATPGRLMDLVKQRKINLKHIDALVIDEADRMLDMGFIPDIKKIFESTSQDQQVLMFTATLNKQIEKIAQQFLKDPQRIAVEQENKSNKNIQQIAYPVADYNQKKLVLVDVLNEADLNQAIIFTATKREADRLSDELYLMNHRSKTLHGDMSQRERTRTINRFKNNEIQILVATDVAARGIDVDDITHVINFDLPRQVEDYIHRIGRTGRAERKGKAISLVIDKEKFMLQKIEKYANIKIEVIKSTHSTSDLSLVYKKKESGFKKKRRSSGSRKKNDKFTSSSKRKKHGFKADVKAKSRRRPVKKNIKPLATAS